MILDIEIGEDVNQRVRAILLTGQGTVLMIKRVKPNNPNPYWVAPGGGVESYDTTLMATLKRELCEELGATAQIIEEAFVLEHEKAGKFLEEHFYICRLQNYDVSKRNGPEFDDPERGLYIPIEVPLTESALQHINIKTEELREWLLDNLNYLRAL